MKSQFKNTKEEVLANWRNAGVISRGSGRYSIRKIENVSAGRVPRVNVTAVLRYPDDADDRELVRQIISSIINETSKVRVNTKEVGLEGDWGWVGRPKYIWLRLCKLDGTIRWLNACDWASGSLVAMAERAYGLWRKPIQIRNPEEVWRGIRIRYSMDMEAMRQLLGDSENTEDTNESDAI